MSTGPLTCPKYIGRTAELAGLHALVEQAKNGQGHLALLAGEAGIGKSRLVAEVITDAQAQGLLVMQASCLPADSACPYAPLLNLVRALFAHPPTSPLLTDLGALGSVLFPLLPDLIPPPDDAIPLPPLEPSQAKYRLEGLLTHLFLSQAARTPILLIVEDLHWSDASSLDVLHVLARRVASQPLLLLVTYRHDEMPPALTHWVTQLDRERLTHEIRLAPFSRNEVEAMLSALFAERQSTDMRGRRFLHGELLEEIYTLTDGNPFFIEEMLSVLMTDGKLFPLKEYPHRRSDGSKSTPRGVQEATKQRIDQVSAEARHVLTLAAVAGRQFDFILLQQLTGYDEHQLLVCMKEVVAAHLVVEASADQFTFRHALTREAIYAQLLTRERRLLHRSIAETLEHSVADADETHLEDLAYHYYQAGMWQKVVDVARRAGEKSLQLYAHHTAIRYFTYAIEAGDHLSQPASPTLYRARGHAYEALGEFDQAQQDYTQALKTALALGDSLAEWQSALDLGFLWAERDYAQAEPWFRQALTRAQALGDPILQAKSLNRLGNWSVNVGRPQEALHSHLAALELFERLNDAPGIAETYDLLGMVSYLSGDLIGGTKYYQQAIARFHDLDDKAGLTSSLATLTLRGPTYQTDCLVCVATLPEVCQDAERALEIAHAIGHRSAEAYALFQKGLCLGSMGHYGSALQAVHQSLSMAEEIEHRQWQAAAYTVLGGIYVGLLAYPQAREYCERALALANDIGSVYWAQMATGYLASIALLQHRPAQATSLLQTMLNPDMPAETMTQRMLWCANVELALAQGQPRHALEMVELLTTSGTLGSAGQGSLRVWQLRGAALAGLQRLDEAIAAYEVAQVLAREQGAQPAHRRIAIALGKLYHTQEKAHESEQAFATARALTESLAATLDDGPLRAHFLQQAFALLPPAPHPSPAHRLKNAFGGLTTREREVAALIAQGHSNQAIAAALVVTKRTVETHIGNIMFKLGYSSRTQIAVWAVETGVAKTAGA